MIINHSKKKNVVLLVFFSDCTRKKHDYILHRIKPRSKNLNETPCIYDLPFMPTISVVLTCNELIHGNILRTYVQNYWESAWRRPVNPRKRHFSTTTKRMELLSFVLLILLLRKRTHRERHEDLPVTVRPSIVTRRFEYFYRVRFKTVVQWVHFCEENNCRLLYVYVELLSYLGMITVIHNATLRKRLLFLGNFRISILYC